MHLGYEVEEDRGIRGIELAGDLVGEEHRRAGDEDRRERRALLLTAGQLRRPMMCSLPEPDAGQRLTRRRPVDRPIGERGGQQCVLLEVEERDEVLALEHDPEDRAAETGPLALLDTRQVDTADDHVPGGRSIRASQQVEERGLARARSTHDGDELASGDLQVDASERDRLDVAFPRHLDDCLGAWLSRGAARIRGAGSP